jgi:predicted nuclease with RNAse H fold
MRVAGIDWAAESGKKAVSILETGDSPGSKWRLSDLKSDPDNDYIRRLVKNEELTCISVDIPFGWPSEFSEFIRDWQPKIRAFGIKVPSGPKFRYRVTEEVVTREANKLPLSVSSDRIAVGALAWARISDELSLAGQIDVEGQGNLSEPKIIEVYPAATMKALGIDITDYKKHRSVRMRVLRDLLAAFYVDGVNEDQMLGDREKDSDEIDSLVSAMTGVYYLEMQNGWNVRKPQGEEIAAARQEGWIFFPKKR